MRRPAEQTKELIKAAARERFAAEGYDRATIRAIAADAGIDPAMVMRYFGSKERLFASVAEFDLALPDLSQAPRDQVGARLAGHFINRWEDDETLQILLRTGATNTAIAERMRAIFAAQLVPIITSLADDPATAPTRAGLAASQVLGIALCRYVLVLPAVAAMNRQDVVDWIGPTLQRYLAGPK